jgi:hypothetical protein
MKDSYDIDKVLMVFVIALLIAIIINIFTTKEKSNEQVIIFEKHFTAPKKRWGSGVR